MMEVDPPPQPAAGATTTTELHPATTPEEAAPAPETEKRVDDVSASPNRDFLFQRHDIS